MTYLTSLKLKLPVFTYHYVTLFFDNNANNLILLSLHKKVTCKLHMPSMIFSANDLSPIMTSLVISYVTNIVLLDNGTKFPEGVCPFSIDKTIEIVWLSMNCTN